jgi:hypothetical protein
VIGQIDVRAYRRLKDRLDRGPRSVRAVVAMMFVVVFLTSALSGLALR